MAQIQPLYAAQKTNASHTKLKYGKQNIPTQSLETLNTKVENRNSIWQLPKKSKEGVNLENRVKIKVSAFTTKTCQK